MHVIDSSYTLGLSPITNNIEYNGIDTILHDHIDFFNLLNKQLTYSLVVCISSILSRRTFHSSSSIYN
jgi:hypothetical protein